MRIRKNGKTFVIAGEEQTEPKTDETGADEKDELKLFGPVLQDGETLTPEFQVAFDALPEKVRDGVSNGHIVADVGLVKRKEAGMQYVRLQAKTAEGCAILSQGYIEPEFVEKDGKQVDKTDGDNVVNHYNYGKDLKVRNLLTQRLAAMVEGPDKALEAAARNIAKAFNISIEAAREKVKAIGV